MLELPHRRGDAENDCSARVPAKTGLQDLCQRRVSKRYVVTFALGLHCNDLSQEEQALIDVLAFSDALTRHVSLRVHYLVV